MTIEKIEPLFTSSIVTSLYFNNVDEVNRHLFTIHFIHIVPNKPSNIAVSTSLSLAFSTIFSSCRLFYRTVSLFVFDSFCQLTFELWRQLFSCHEFNPALVVQGFLFESDLNFLS